MIARCTFLLNLHNVKSRQMSCFVEIHVKIKMEHVLVAFLTWQTFLHKHTGKKKEKRHRLLHYLFLPSPWIGLTSHTMRKKNCQILLLFLFTNKIVFKLIITFLIMIMYFKLKFNWKEKPFLLLYRSFLFSSTLKK